MLLPALLVAVVLAGDLPTFGRRRAGARSGDRGSYLALNALIGAGYWAAFSVAARRGPALGVWASALGCALAIGGTIFRRWAIATLGRWFTRVVQVSRDQPVIQDGPYRLLRHPSYTGGIVAALGVGFALRRWESVAFLLAGMSSMLYRIRVEERALVEELGAPYEAYRRKTWRLVPYVW